MCDERLNKTFTLLLVFEYGILCGGFTNGCIEENYLCILTPL
jgi:hypothetical protein